MAEVEQLDLAFEHPDVFGLDVAVRQAEGVETQGPCYKLAENNPYRVVGHHSLRCQDARRMCGGDCVTDEVEEGVVH